MSALPIKVYIRTRPTTEFAGENIKIHDDRQTVSVNIDKSDPLNFLNTPECNYNFKFHSILHNASQEIVFEEAAREIVDSFIQGYNGSIFGMGQRGAGKTFTMFGGIRHFKYRGVVPRAIAYIFQELEKFKTIQFTISLQFFQIHQDMIYDLLSDEEKEMQVAEDEAGNPFIQNLSVHQVKDVHKALQLLIDGDAKLHFMEHKYKRAVHRSHVVFILDLVGRKGTRMTHSRLLMSDLAASDEADDSAFVNKSISYLQQLVVSIVNKDTRHLPFRRSKMTYILRDAIGGNCRSACLACVWPEKPNNRMSISTFQFANELGKVRNDARVNMLEPPELRIEKLQTEIGVLEAESELQAELGGAVKIDGLNHDEETQVSDLVALFLADEIDSVPLQSICHMKAVFSEIKRRYLDIPNQVMREVSQNFTLAERVKNAKAPKDVGTIDGTGFSIGVAASQDRPCNIRTAMKAELVAASSGGRADNPQVPTKEQMFEVYKLRDGKATASELIQVKHDTKSLMTNKKQAVSDINGLQQHIVEIAHEIDGLGIRTKDQIFEEEAALLRDERDSKKRYQELYQTIQRTQGEIDGLKEKGAQVRIVLLAAFDEWHEKWSTDQLYTEPVVAPHNEAETPANAKDAGKGKKPPPPRPAKGKPTRGRR